MRKSKTLRVRARIALFAYGTLLDAKVQRRVFGREVDVMPARLTGWSVRQNLVRGRYPGIVRADGANATGGVLRITAAERALADVYEGAPQLYRRERVTARVGTKRVRCWVYVPTPLSSNR